MLVDEDDLTIFKNRFFRYYTRKIISIIIAGNGIDIGKGNL